MLKVEFVAFCHGHAPDESNGEGAKRWVKRAVYRSSGRLEVIQLVRMGEEFDVF